MHYGPVMIDVQGVSLTDEERQLLQHPRVGGVILFTRNYQGLNQIKNLVTEIRACTTNPLLITVDHEGGRVWRFNEGFTKLPAAKQYGMVYQHDVSEALKLARNAGWVMAAELLDCGIDLSLAPVLDLDKGISEVIGDRAFGSDAKIVTELAKAFIEGMNTVGMSATGKHFPGHGGCALDSHIAKPVDERSLEVLMNDDMIPFKNLSSVLGAVMPAHITYTAVDSVPAGFSKRWLQGILRDKLNFEGAVISDCLSMKGAAIGGDFVVRAQMALDAGCDMVILCQQERNLVSWVLDNLGRDAKTSSNNRLSKLAGKFNNKARLAPKPVVADIWEVS
jgi:beta-N-acetylhexosaminidase